jgi:hypothetical protein
MLNAFMAEVHSRDLRDRLLAEAAHQRLVRAAQAAPRPDRARRRSRSAGVRYLRAAFLETLRAFGAA